MVCQFGLCWTTETLLLAGPGSAPSFATVEKVRVEKVHYEAPTEVKATEETEENFRRQLRKGYVRKRISRTKVTSGTSKRNPMISKYKNLINKLRKRTMRMVTAEAGINVLEQVEKISLRSDQRHRDDRCGRKGEG